VAICDPRLHSKSYGKQLLASLPPLKRTRDLLDVQRMLAGIVRERDEARRA
jgi:ATP-dependent DNA helicase DinG